MKIIAASLSLILGLVLPATAFAYVGPGAGLSLLGALWAFVLALGMALVFIVAWPVRSMLRKRRAQRSRPGEDSSPQVHTANSSRPRR